MARPDTPRWARFLSLSLATALVAACQPASQADPPQDAEDDTVTTGQTTDALPNAPEPNHEALLTNLTAAGDQE